MIRPLAVAAFAAALTPPASLALAKSPASTPAGMDAAFTNTIVSTYPDGRTAKLWLNRDGGYTAQGRRGDRSSGSWRVKGEKICLKQSHPFAAPFTFCTAMAHGGVGTSWNSKAVTGEAVRIKVVAGR